MLAPPPREAPRRVLPDHRPYRDTLIHFARTEVGEPQGRCSWWGGAWKSIVQDKSEGRGLLGASPTVGSEVPVHCPGAASLLQALAPNDSSSAATIARAQRVAVGPVDLPTWATTALAQVCSANLEHWQPCLPLLAAPVFVRRKIRDVLAPVASGRRLAETGREASNPCVVAANRQIAYALQDRSQERLIGRSVGGR